MTMLQTERQALHYILRNLGFCNSLGKDLKNYLSTE